MRKEERRYNRDERASIKHAIMHLDANEIADDAASGLCWYCGNRKQFVSRHIKAMALLREMLADTKGVKR